MSDEQLGFEISIQQSYEQALESVAAALKTQGFGILTRIDVRATMKEKLGADFRPYAILGACNPPLAHRALSASAEMGLMLPCNVTVEETQPGHSMVRIANPNAMLPMANPSNNPELQAVAAQATEKLRAVAEVLKQGKPS